MRIWAAVTTALFLCFAPLVSSADPVTTVLVPGGTSVPIRVVGQLSSSALKAGDTFSFQAASDVIVNGMIVIRSGALGSGTAADVNAAGGNGHSGSLMLDFDWIYAVDGGKVRLARSTQRQAEEDRKGASSTATIIGFATFGLGGLFGHNLARGRDVTIDSGKVLSAFVSDNVHVEARERGVADHFDR